jgi:hypothetical protein
MRRLLIGALLAVPFAVAAQIPSLGDLVARTPDGGFTLTPGVVYELRAQSFCLLAGSRGPGKGDGYLDAPLSGPMSGVIQHALDRASSFPDIQQTDLQMLLWSILAHAKVTDLPRSLQTVAARLLDPSELVKVNGGALGLIPDAVKQAAFDRLPPAVARVLSAEADLRDLISRGVVTYEEMERIAVPDNAEDEPGEEIPAERWNFRNGLFVRYQPDG